MESLAELAAAVPDLIIEVPNRRNWFSLRLDQLPPTLAGDISNWLAADQGTDTRLRRSRLNGAGHPHRRPIRPGTAASYRQLMLQFITMETLAGVPLDSLRTLAEVVDLDNVDRGLAEYERHFGGAKRRHLGQVMRVVCLAARHWVRLPAEQVAEMWSWTKDVSVPRHGMTPKNKTLLLSLGDPRVLARLLGLGPKVIREVLAGPRIREADAVRAQVAFAIVLLLNAPARIGNIASIHLDRHVRRLGADTEQRVMVEFPGAEVKNGRELRYPLLDATKELLDLYLARVRPKLVNNPMNRWLFPGEGDGPKGSALLSQQIGNLTEEVVGFRITAHQVRHIMGTLRYGRSGHDAATVARALGNDEATVRQYYTFLSQEEALKSWNETLKLKQEEFAPLIDGTGSKPRRRRRGKS